MAEPRYKHDCAACIYIGPHDGVREKLDVYICGVGRTATVVVRFSSEGPDYFSKPVSLMSEFHRDMMAGMLAHHVTA